MQTLRPVSTVSAGGWTANTGTIHDALTVESADAFIKTAAGAVTTARVKLASGDTPAAGTRTLRYGVSRLATNRAVTLEVRLYQGDTLLETSTHVNPGTAHPAMTAVDLEVTATISDYTDLYAEIAVTSAHAAGEGFGYYIALDIPDADAGGTDLTLDGGSHVSTLAAVALSVVVTLTPAPLTHAQTVEPAAVTQAHGVTVDTLTHAHTVGAVEVAEDGTAPTYEFGEWSETASILVVGQSAYDLTPEALSHAQTVQPTDLAQAHQLGPEALAHAQTLAGTMLATAGELLPAALTHAQTIEAAALTQAQQLGVDSAAHAQTLAGAMLATAGELLPDGLSHSQTLAPTSATQAHALTADDIAHAQTLDAAALDQAVALTTAGLFHAQTLAVTELTAAGDLSPASLTHAQTLGAAAITQAQDLTPDGLAQAQTLAPAAVTLVIGLTPDPLAHAQTLEPVEVLQAGDLIPAALLQAQTAAGAALTQLHGIDPDDLAQPQMLAVTSIVIGLFTRDVLIQATPYSHPLGVPGERLWRLYEAGQPTPIREWGWGAPTTLLRVNGVPVGSYEVTVQDRTALASSLASPRHAFEVAL